MELVSYASEYDLFDGWVSIGELPDKEQDELIRTVFSTDGDYRDLVMRKGIKKAQVEGLWALIVFVGLELERAQVITDFESRTDGDIQEIISFFSGSRLWLRLEEAFPPFDCLEEKTEYDWSELESVRIEYLTEVSGEPLYKIKSKLMDFLSSSGLSLQSNVIERMPYHAFESLYKEGKVAVFVDRGLAPLAKLSGCVDDPMTSFLPWVFILGLVSVIPVWFFLGFWVALVVLFMSFAAKIVFNILIMTKVRRAAVEDKRCYRWFLSRKIIWLTYIWK